MNFEEWYEQEIGSDNKPEYESAWAWDYQQDSINELQKKYDAIYNAFVVADDCRKEWHRCYVGVRQNEDKLQSRIDKALELLNDQDDQTTVRFIRNTMNTILKGNQDV